MYQPLQDSNLVINESVANDLGNAMVKSIYLSVFFYIDVFSISHFVLLNFLL